MMNHFYVSMVQNLFQYAIVICGTKDGVVGGCLEWLVSSALIGSHRPVDKSIILRIICDVHMQDSRNLIVN